MSVTMIVYLCPFLHKGGGRGTGDNALCKVLDPNLNWF